MQRSRQLSKKVFQQRGIELQIRRQLEQDWTQLPCSRQRFNGSQEAGQEVFHALQPLDVSNHLVRFHAETEVRGCVRDPVVEGAFLHQLPKCEVHFDRVELRAVVAQKFLLRKFRWIKIWFPARVRPSRGACKELRHVQEIA